MKIEVYFDDFVNAFRSHGREGSFSYEGFVFLYSYIDELYGEDYILDVIEIDSEFYELSDVEFAKELPDPDTIVSRLDGSVICRS